MFVKQTYLFDVFITSIYLIMHRAIPATLLLCLLVVSTASAQDAADGK